MDKPVVIWGCGGHGREVRWLCDQIGVQVLGFLDERETMKGSLIDGLPVFGDLLHIEGLRETADVVCAGIGDPRVRQRLMDKSINAGFQVSRPLIHPTVLLSHTVRLGAGSVICAGCTLTVNISLGRCVVINRNATIGHDVTCGDFVTVAPGVNISGNVAVDSGAYLGTGASIREKVHIGAWSVIGGQAFVNSDVPAGKMYGGVPAVYLKDVGPGTRILR